MRRYFLLLSLLLTALVLAGCLSLFRSEDQFAGYGIITVTAKLPSSGAQPQAAHVVGASGSQEKVRFRISRSSPALNLVRDAEVQPGDDPSVSVEVPSAPNYAVSAITFVPRTASQGQILAAASRGGVAVMQDSSTEVLLNLVPIAYTIDAPEEVRGGELFQVTFTFPDLPIKPWTVPQLKRGVQPWNTDGGGVPHWEHKAFEQSGDDYSVTYTLAAPDSEGDVILYLQIEFCVDPEWLSLGDQIQLLCVYAPSLRAGEELYSIKVLEPEL